MSGSVTTRRPGAAVVALGILAQLLPGAVPTVRAADPVEVVFAYTGSEQTFIVPDGVTSLHVVLVGACGGAGASGNSGGCGARVAGDIAVAPGSSLYVEVGGHGATLTGGGGGFNGGAAGGDGEFEGGGGGGASDVRLVPKIQGIDSDPSRLMVAGGGGGSGGGSVLLGGGGGGNAGLPGQDATGSGAHGGGAGTATQGGIGGMGEFGLSGSNGSAANGGAGGGPGAGAGGGGGGGWFGGGGGGGAASSPSGGGGGGGGSSYTGDATNATVELDASGTPSITISYVPDAGGGGTSETRTVSADVTIPTSAACLELTTTSVSFGTLPLGANNEQASPQIEVTNCSGVSETILARGTNATGTGASWTLTDAAATCVDTLGLDAYRLGLESAAAGLVQLSNDNKALYEVAAGGAATNTAVIDTACPGSSGSGTTMSMQIIFLATE